MRGGEQEYFRTHFQTQLQYPELPCIETKRGRLYPIELCTIQPVRRLRLHWDAWIAGNLADSSPLYRGPGRCAVSTRSSRSSLPLSRRSRAYLCRAVFENLADHLRTGLRSASGPSATSVLTRSPTPMFPSTSSSFCAILG